jgi:DNA-directed RNA polymerase specialized sigma24 family protein
VEESTPRIRRTKGLDYTQVNLLYSAQLSRIDKKSIPPELKSDYKPQILYDEYDYNYDNIIANWVWNREFKKYLALAHLEEDIKCGIVAHLWKHRLKYTDMKNATYRTFAYMVARQYVWKIIGDKQWQYENNIFDNGIAELDKKFGETENGIEITLYDIVADKIATNETQDNTLDNFDARNAHYETMHKIKNQRQRQIITYYAQGYKTQEIADKLKCNRSYAGKVKAKYKNEIQNGVKSAIVSNDDE